MILLVLSEPLNQRVLLGLGHPDTTGQQYQGEEYGFDIVCHDDSNGLFYVEATVRD